MLFLQVAWKYRCHCLNIATENYKLSYATLFRKITAYSIGSIVEAFVQKNWILCQIIDRSAVGCSVSLATFEIHFVGFDELRECLSSLSVHEFQMSVKREKLKARLRARMANRANINEL